MPNHQPYQNAPGGQIPRPPGPRTESAATASPPTAQQRPQEGTQSFADRAEQVVEQVKTSAIERVGDVRSRAQSELTDQRGKIAQRVHRVGDVLRGASQQIRHEDEFVSHYLEVAGGAVDRVANYVSSTDPSRLGSDVQQFARSRPIWFIGGAFVAGLAMGRFLRSAAPRELASTPELAGSRQFAGAAEFGGSRELGGSRDFANSEDPYMERL